MLKTDIKLIIRNLQRSRIVSSINVISLTIGFTFVILTGRYVYTEMTYDRFHQDYNSISRVEVKMPDRTVCFTSNILHSWINSNIPEIKKSTRIINDRSRIVLHNQSKYNIDKPLIVDYDFFSMFSFSLLSGETESFKTDKYSVALSEQLASKIFGNSNPIGKSILYKDELFTIRAVLKDIPSNSSLKFDLLLPITNIPKYVTNDWRNKTLQIFVSADNRISHGDLQLKINEGVISVFKSLGFEEQASSMQYILNPLKKIYYSDYSIDNICIHGDPRFTFLLLSLSILVLFIALINYINSSIAGISKNIKGIGIKSITGASRNNNIRFLILQTTLPCIFATIFAIVISVMLESLFEQTLGVPLVKISYVTVLFIIGSTTIISLVIGTYPSIKISSIKITDSLKNVYRTGAKAVHFRSILSVAQFVATIALIISLFTINRQVDYVLQQSIENFDEEIVLYIPITNRSEQKSQKVKTIQESLKSLPEIEETSTCLHLPGDEFYSDIGRSLNHNGEEKFIQVNHNYVDAEFPQVLGYSIVNGRFFDKNLKSDYQNYIVNETFIKKQNINDISNTTINGSPIIGVIKDFHYNSLQNKIQPLAIRYDDYYQSMIVVRLVSSKIESLAGVINKIEESVNKIDNAVVTDILFLDQHVISLYDKEVKTSKIILVLSVFSILISCMGLFAISLFIANTKTKEIGIRKVNGAKVSEILTMLNKDFIKWVAIAFIIACPIAYYAMNKWLQNFAYKTALSWWIFALAGALALGIALLTVSWQSWRAATRNPVEALRYE